MSIIDEIVEKCRGNELPPCQVACPLHVDAKGYINLAKQGKLEEALKVVYDTLPFPGILGRVCVHPCELQCRRGEVDEAIAIAGLKRFIFDNAVEFELRSVPPEDRKDRVAIVGGGPAGLMAAYELRKKGYQITIFEASSVLGGMLAIGIPEYRLPRDVLNRELGIIARMGIKVRLNTRIGDKIELSDLRQDYKAVFIASGARLSQRLNIEGSELEGILWGMDFLREVNLGYKVEVGDKVIVVGGGDVAIDAARTALRLGAKQVEIVYRRSKAEMPAREIDVTEAEKEGIDIGYLTSPGKIKRKADGNIELECFRMKLGATDESGRRKPVPISNSGFAIEADTVIFAVGQVTDTFFIDSDSGIKCASGYIVADEVTGQTSVPGIFAGGDAVYGPKSVIEALAAGKSAAISIDRYLQGKDMASAKDKEGSRESRLAVDIQGIEIKKRMSMPVMAVNERELNFKEVETGFSHDKAKEEAERCLQCECKLCVKDCDFLALYCDTPKGLAGKFKDGYLRDKPEIAYSCNICGLCERVCPEHLNIGEMCMDLRNDLIEEGVGPLSRHQKVVDEQAWVTSDSFTLTLPSHRSAECERVFFPGCNLSACSPELVIKCYDYLQSKLPGTGIILGCCGAPTEYIGERSRFLEISHNILAEMEQVGASELIVACPDCYHTFKKIAPHISLVSIYEVMVEHGLPRGVEPGEQSFFIHDSCKTRYESGIQDSVRAIAGELGYKINEPEYSKDKTRCCGMGGMVAYADMKLSNKVTMRRAKEMPGNVLTYCASCRDAFALVGKPSVHILDIMFNPKLEEAKKRFPVIGTARRKNQAELKARLSARAGTTAQ